MRCSMTTQAVDELPKDPSVLRTIVRDANQNLGVYATVEAAGEVAVGDPVDCDARRALRAEPNLPGRPSDRSGDSRC